MIFIIIVLILFQLLYSVLNSPIPNHQQTSSLLVLVQLHALARRAYDYHTYGKQIQGNQRLKLNRIQLNLFEKFKYLTHQFRFHSFGIAIGAADVSYCNDIALTECGSAFDAIDIKM